MTAPGTENPGNRGMPLLNSRALLCVLKYTQTVESVKNLTCSPWQFPFLVKETDRMEEGQKEFQMKTLTLSPKQKRILDQNVAGP